MFSDFAFQSRGCSERVGSCHFIRCYFIAAAGHPLKDLIFQEFDLILQCSAAHTLKEADVSLISCPLSSYLIFHKC